MVTRKYLPSNSTILAVVLILLVPLHCLEATPVEFEFGVNLIENPGAEDGGGSSDGSQVSVPGWVENNNFTVVKYGAVVGLGAYPDLDDPGPPDRGDNFFSGGQAQLDAEAYQVIDVPPDYAAAIDTGGVRYELNGYLGGFKAHSGQATLTVSFSDASGGEFSHGASIGPVTPVHREWQTGLLYRELAEYVPPTTRHIKLVLRMDNAYMSNDGYADNLSLVLYGPDALDTVYVDDDAPQDPGPYDLTTSDPNEDGTRAHPYDSVQEAIEQVADDGTVIVLAGTYIETLDLLGKAVEVTSAEPNQPEALTFPVIDADDQGVVVTFAGGEQADCVLRGFVLIGGLGAIDCRGTSPTIRNCVITGNRSAGPDRGVIHCVDSHAIFENCTIADNYGHDQGAAIYLVNSDPNLSNCIIWNNLPDDFAFDANSLPLIRFGDTPILWPDEGNIEAEPLFALPGYWADPTDSTNALDPADATAVWIPGDYHLLSFAGRWDPPSAEWLIDEVLSPCIDAGDPATPWEMEPQPNGGRINIGAYGGTSQASKTGFSCVLTTLSLDGGSVVLPGEGEFAYECGTPVDVEAAPQECYRFVRWTGTAVEAGVVDDPSDARTTMVLSTDHTLEANFEPIQYSLIVSANNGGTLTAPGVGSFAYDCGTSVSIEARAEACYQFAGWTGTAVEEGKVDNASDPNATLMMDADYTLEANFEPIQYRLIVSHDNGGLATAPGEGDFTYNCGTSVPIKAQAEACYQFAGWTGTAVEEGKVDNASDPNTILMMDADYTLEANFESIRYDLTATSTESGSVAVPGEGVFAYECGASVAVEATPQAHSHFVGWSGTAVDAGKVADPTKASTTVTMDADYTLEAKFAPDQHTVTFSSTEGGDVNLAVIGDGASYSWLDEHRLSFDHGTKITLTATAEPGYEFANWSGPIWSTADYLLLSVDQDYDLTASFIAAAQP